MNKFVPLAALTLASCGSGSDMQFTPMGGLNNWALLIPLDAQQAEIEAAAKEKCRSDTHCSVLGWTDEANMAETMEMLDREYAALKFRYDVNRTTSHEQVLWDCSVFKQASKAHCLDPPAPSTPSP